jgi:hypothetical protein
MMVVLDVLVSDVGLLRYLPVVLMPGSVLLLISDFVFLFSYSLVVLSILVRFGLRYLMYTLRDGLLIVV